jgi:carboxymethylenebutenolidase
MPEINLNINNDHFLTYLAEPEGQGKKPGVVVIHDALGMSTDMRNQCDWLAEEGYMAAAPDLFDGRTFFGCMFSILKEFNRRRGPVFDKIEQTRQHLLAHPDSNGKVGAIGFCFGGGFAVILSSGYGFESASVNYGALPKNAQEELKNACPIVASYGALDKNLKNTAARLEEILISHDIEHDVKEYPQTDHAFMNNHDPNEVPFFINIISMVFGGGAYHSESARDARKRIIAFFDKTLK